MPESLPDRRSIACSDPTRESAGVYQRCLQAFLRDLQKLNIALLFQLIDTLVPCVLPPLPGRLMVDPTGTAHTADDDLNAVSYPETKTRGQPELPGGHWPHGDPSRARQRRRDIGLPTIAAPQIGFGLKY